MRTATSGSTAPQRQRGAAAARAAQHPAVIDWAQPADADDARIFSVRFDDAADLDETMRSFRDACETQAADDRYD